MTGEKLAEIYDEHAHALFAFLLNLTRSEQDAHDILHDVFVNFSKRAQTTAPILSMRAWLMKCCHREAIDFFRKNTNRNKLHHAAHEQTNLFISSPSTADNEFSMAAADGLLALSAEQRAVVHLKIWEDMTFAQIGDVLKIPANTAASRYRYALIKLKNLLEPQTNSEII